MIYHFVIDCETHNLSGACLGPRRCVCIWISLGEGCVPWMYPVCPFTHSEFFFFYFFIFCGLPHICGHEPGCPPLDELTLPKVMGNEPPDHGFPCCNWELDPFHLCFSFIYSVIHLWLRWVCIAARGLSLDEVGGLFSSCSGQASHCSGFSSCRARALRCASSVAAALVLSCPGGCEIFPDHGLNPCPLHWQVDS